MANEHERNCYWYTQNRCQLKTMEEGMVYSILAQVPEARASLRTCGFDCPYVNIDYITFAETKGTLVEDETVENARFTKQINAYKDRHRLIEANPTLPKDEE